MWNKQQEFSLKVSWRSDLIWLRYLRSKNIFICVFVCLFVHWFVCLFILIILGHPQEMALKFLWRSDLIWLRYLGSKKCLFVCFFLCLFIDLFVFYFNHLGTPTGSYPKNFVKILLDLAEMFSIHKFICFSMFVWLFLCLF